MQTSQSYQLPSSQKSPLVVLVGCLLAFHLAGCGSIERPKTVVLLKSDYPAFRYRVQIQATEIIRFNIHQLKPDHAESPYSVEVYLTKRIGKLSSSDFAISYGGVPTAESDKGVVEISENQITIAVEVVSEISPKNNKPVRYHTFEANGRYQLLDQTGDYSSLHNPKS